MQQLKASFLPNNLGQFSGIFQACARWIHIDISVFILDKTSWVKMLKILLSAGLYIQRSAIYLDGWQEWSVQNSYVFWQGTAVFPLEVPHRLDSQQSHSVLQNVKALVDKEIISESWCEVQSRLFPGILTRTHIWEQKAPSRLNFKFRELLIQRSSRLLQSRPAERHHFRRAGTSALLSLLASPPSGKMCL